MSDGQQKWSVTLGTCRAIHYDIIYHISYIVYRISYIIYHISYIIFHISYFIYHISYIISYHIISYHIISYHIISYHIISYHIISYHIRSYHMIWYDMTIFLQILHDMPQTTCWYDTSETIHPNQLYGWVTHPHVVGFCLLGLLLSLVVSSTNLPLDEPAPELLNNMTSIETTSNWSRLVIFHYSTHRLQSWSLDFWIYEEESETIKAIII